VADFSKLDSARDFLVRALAVIRERTDAVGVDAWISDPAQREARERSVRILTSTVKRVDREADALVRAGVPEPAVRERAFRTPRPASRASR
jgi:hypothetical protein